MHITTVIHMGASHYDVTSVLNNGAQHEEAHVDLAQKVWGLNRQDRLEALGRIAGELCRLHDIAQHKKHAHKRPHAVSPRTPRPATKGRKVSFGVTPPPMVMGEM